MFGLLKPLIKNSKDYSSINESERKKLYKDLTTVLHDSTPIITTQNERILIRKIKEETKQHNINNITRTNAYLRFYNNHLEIHWAFLAHMVSRNGGYSMTDLKSSMIGHFMDDKKKELLFHFLERANALIFHDAYPQLLLYEKSKEDNTSYFHLLPAFHISKFMIPNWQHFLMSPNSTLLTLALITNEQNYVEKHLMSMKTTKETIFNTLTYVLQEKLGLTHVIFPYKRYSFLRSYSLTGIEVHEFSSVHDRIKIGKQLYSILFSKQHFDSIIGFANNYKHTGSRSDYWPHLFSKDTSHTHKIYSPSLPHAWKNISHQFPSKQDWLTNSDQITNFEKGISLEHADITKDVKRDLTMLMTLIQIKNEIDSISF